jgi:hypothetical protein
MQVKKGMFLVSLFYLSLSGAGMGGGGSGGDGDRIGLMVSALWSLQSTLDRWSQLNVESDSLTKCHLLVASRHLCYYLLHDEPWSLWYFSKKQ